MTENKQSQQPFDSPKEPEISIETDVNEVKQNHPYKRHTHISLDPREDHYKK